MMMGMMIGHTIEGFQSDMIKNSLRNVFNPPSFLYTQLLPIHFFFYSSLNNKMISSSKTSSTVNGLWDSFSLFNCLVCSNNASCAFLLMDMLTRSSLLSTL